MADNVYGNGTNSTAGANTITHYYDKAGVKAANSVSIYSQWADRRSMPLKMGKTYKTSKWLHIYENEIGDANFEAKGYLTARNIVDVSSGLTSDNGNGAVLNGGNAVLGEGAGATNKVSIKKVTIETPFARYGEMLDYTDEVDMFSEDMVQVHYREELGILANRRQEDLIQLDMLATPTNLLVGNANSFDQVGIDSNAGNGTTDGASRVNYDLIRRAVRKLVRNRAMKNTSIVTGSTKIDTRVINKAFYAIIGPEVKFDLETITKGTGSVEEYAYIPAYKYADATNLAEGEVGAMNDVRFIESETQLVYRGAGNVVGAYTGTLANTLISTPAEATALNGLTAGAQANGETRFDVFPILLPTKGSFATVGLKGHGKIKFRSQSPDKVELANVYGTTGFFSYNMWYAGIILREERLLKILVCASS